MLTPGRVEYTTLDASHRRGGAWEMMRWYVLETKTTQEKLAERELVAEGFEPYLPVYEKSISHARRVSVVTRPLFAGYLFCRFDLGAPWQRILHTRGVAGVLGAPSHISDRIVAEIRTRCGGVGAKLRCGDRVRVRGGVWEGVEGLFVSADSARVRVLLSLLGRDVEKEFPRGQIVRR